MQLLLQPSHALWHASFITKTHSEDSKSVREDRANIAARLEQVVSSMFTAINDRRFDSTLAPWICILEDFKFESTGSPCQAISRNGFIKHLQELAESCPSLRKEVSKLEAHVYEAAGYAEVYANLESVGDKNVPLALKRKFVAVYEFRRPSGGDWLASKMTTILGFDDEMYMAEPPKDEEQVTRTHFEKILRGIFKSINTRSFDLGQSHWVSVAPDFSVSSPGASQRAGTKVDFIDYLRELTETYPSFEMRLGRMDMHMYKASGYAEVYANVETVGGDDVPLAIKRPSVGAYEFRRVYGEVWLATRLTAIMGAPG